MQHIRTFSINYTSLFARCALLLLYYMLVLFLIKVICLYTLHFEIFSFIFLIIVFSLVGLKLLVFVRYFIKQCNSFYPSQANNNIDSFCSVTFFKGIHLYTSSLIFINKDLIFYSEKRVIPDLILLKIWVLCSKKKMSNWYCYKNEKVEINIDKDYITINGKAIAYENQQALINELKRFKYL